MVSKVSEYIGDNKNLTFEDFNDIITQEPS